MKKKCQGLIAGVLIGAVFTNGLAFASTSVKYIEIIYDNIKIYKDNVLCELKDANGNTIEPFIYNGTTYMPIRGTANIADMEVTWDGNTKSIYLWDELPSENTYLMDVCPPYETKSCKTFLQQNGKTFAMAGMKFSNGFTIGRNGYAMINLNSKYKDIEFTIGHTDGSSMSSESVISFFLDDRLIEQLTIDPYDMPKTISLPVEYGLQLKIISNVEKNNSNPQIGFGNITVK